MGDPEIGAGRQRRAQALQSQRFRPQLARNIGHNADAVAFAIDEAGAMSHTGQGFNRAFDVAVRGFAAFANGANQGAGIAFAGIFAVEEGRE